MFRWANSQLEKWSDTLAPPPSDAAHHFLQALRGQDDAAALEIVSGLDLYQAVSVSGGTLPIHAAAEHGRLGVVQALVEQHGVPVDTFDAQGQTALFYAAQSKHNDSVLAVVQYLLQQGSHVVLKNARGQTAYDVAQTQTIRQYLLPLQLQAETQYALDHGGAGLPKGIDMGGLHIANSTMAPPPTQLTTTNSSYENPTTNHHPNNDNDYLQAMMQPPPMRLPHNTMATPSSYPTTTYPPKQQQQQQPPFSPGPAATPMPQQPPFSPAVMPPATMTTPSADAFQAPPPDDTIEPVGNGDTNGNTMTTMNSVPKVVEQTVAVVGNPMMPPVVPARRSMRKATSEPMSSSNNNHTPSSKQHNNGGYARGGSSSAAVLPKESKYRPDGFHSSSSDVQLQKKYGHVATPPTSGGMPLPSNHQSFMAPPPTSSTATTTTTTVSGGGGAPPRMIPASMGGRHRYPTYDPIRGTAAAVPAAPPAPSMGYGMPSPNHYPPNTTNNNPVVAAAAAGFTMFNPAARSNSAGSRMGGGGGTSMAAAPAPMVPQSSSWQGYGAPSTPSDPSNHANGGWTNPPAPTPPSAYNNGSHPNPPQQAQPQPQAQPQMVSPPSKQLGGGGIMASAPPSGEHVASIFSSASPTHAVKHIATTTTPTPTTTTPDAVSPSRPQSMSSSRTTRDPRMSSALHDSVVPTTPVVAAGTGTVTAASADPTVVVTAVDPTLSEDMDMADVPLDGGSPSGGSPAMVDISLTSPPPTSMPSTTLAFSDAASLFGGLGMPPPPFSRRSAS